ncbi:MAG: type II toxin-antitoxin system VapC family toxin [Acidobacteria bacterium]|nr:type II toxin-antitoxin system VapC family toxin [Acidobacteriota bacterium]
MRILLDTQCWLWMTLSPDRLSPKARSLVERGGDELYLSAASAWEIAIKYSVGKLRLPEPPGRYVPSRLEALRVVPLPIEHSHALHVATLPRHHRDPFDRVLIAQAQMENLQILTADPLFAAYDVTTIDA